MDYKNIEQLIERYWQCQTTEEEERILRAFFSQEDVPARLLKWKEVFVYPALLQEDEQLGDDFDARVLSLVDQQPTVKEQRVNLAMSYRPLMKAVAMVAIVLTLCNAIQYSLNRGEIDAEGPDAESEGMHIGITMASADSLVADSMQLTPYTEVVKEPTEDIPISPVLIQ